jgi:hypothetical protein
MELKENFKLIKEYKKYYLYGYEVDGKILYRECFLKVDIDGVIATPKVTGNTSKYLHT